MTRIRTVIFAITSLSLCNAAQAQDDKTSAAPPVTPDQRAIMFDPNVFRVPSVPTDYHADKSRPSVPADNKPDVAVPNKFDLGQYSLHVGTANGVADLAPKPSIDPNDGIARPTSRVSPLNKNFYGFTLSTPIR